MRRGINYYFLLLAALLLGAGSLFLATLSAPASMQAFGNTSYYIFHQLIAIGIGLVMALIAFKIPLHFLKKMSLPLLALNVVLLIIVFLPILGTTHWGARRWISFFGMSLQPSEFLKITAILYLSAWLSTKFSENHKRGLAALAKKTWQHFIKIYLPFLFLLGTISAFLYFQKDMSTLGVIILSLLAVYFAAGTPLWHTVLSFLGGAGGALLLIKIEPYRMQRFLVFLHPDTDPLGIGFQLRQSLLAIGSGGIFGKGLGMSIQKFNFLPQAMGDSVFPIIGEELGIVGCAAIIILFLLFFWQGIKIAKNSTDKFGKLAAMGIVVWLSAQTFMNIASSVGFWPLAGIPLPFFSYGGSHIMAELAAVGLLLNISKNG
ncbi:MAG TPA: putative peptidoglycan glycosyltransferase FtsW [Negativicutes bacterium]|nr:MAG: hypothetical protein A3A12_01295 [Candidatus Staskawiczbacteria bacterium RIFCSPLOWO2_01_FULL_43_17b]HLD70264.1 putative peptidoglycan glycosyltransferase FtsW [Negativicutes bacterium]